MASDVCKLLGLKAKYATARCGADELSKVARNDLGMTAGRAMISVSESGLYKIIMRSDKPEAKEFQNWVTRVVLPAIRKDGGYVMGEEKVATGEMSEDELALQVDMIHCNGDFLSYHKLLILFSFQIGSTIEAAALLLLYTVERPVAVAEHSCSLNCSDKHPPRRSHMSCSLN